MAKTYRGAYSGSGKDPLPAKGSFMEDQSNKSPAHPDYAGGRTAKTNVDRSLKYSGGNEGFKGGNEK